MKCENLSVGKICYKRDFSYHYNPKTQCWFKPNFGPDCCSLLYSLRDFKHDVNILHHSRFHMYIDGHYSDRSFYCAIAPDSNHKEITNDYVWECMGRDSIYEINGMMQSSQNPDLVVTYKVLTHQALSYGEWHNSIFRRRMNLGGFFQVRIHLLKEKYYTTISFNLPKRCRKDGTPFNHKFIWDRAMRAYTMYLADRILSS